MLEKYRRCSRCGKVFPLYKFYNKNKQYSRLCAYCIFVFKAKNIPGPYVDLTKLFDIILTGNGQYEVKDYPSGEPRVKILLSGITLNDLGNIADAIYDAVSDIYPKSGKDNALVVIEKTEKTSSGYFRIVDREIYIGSENLKEIFSKFFRKMVRITVENIEGEDERPFIDEESSDYTRGVTLFKSSSGEVR